MIYVYVHKFESMLLSIGLNIHTNKACEVDMAQTIIQILEKNNSIRQVLQCKTENCKSN